MKATHSTSRTGICVEVVSSGLPAALLECDFPGPSIIHWSRQPASRERRGSSSRTASSNGWASAVHIGKELPPRPTGALEQLRPNLQPLGGVWKALAGYLTRIPGMQLPLTLRSCTAQFVVATRLAPARPCARHICRVLCRRLQSFYKAVRALSAAVSILSEGKCRVRMISQTKSQPSQPFIQSLLRGTFIQAQTPFAPDVWAVEASWRWDSLRRATKRPQRFTSHKPPRPPTPAAGRPHPLAGRRHRQRGQPADARRRRRRRRARRRPLPPPSLLTQTPLSHLPNSLLSNSPPQAQSTAARARSSASCASPFPRSAGGSAARRARRASPRRRTFP